MRPIFLRLQAFGPYKTVETVDFAELGGNKLFLIHGETGAGKTSILDAMVFALYGDTSGGERQGAQMRCESAEPGLATEVAFSFGLGRRSFRVVRRPRQELAGQRAGALVQKQAEAKLWETTAAGTGDEGKLLATRIREVDERVHELLGFSSEQFRQVVILPQGKFRDLLAAGSDKREEILRQLFRTEECADLERRLRERAQEVRQQRERQKLERVLLLKHAAVADEAVLAAVTGEAVVAFTEAGEGVAAAEAVAQHAAGCLAEAQAADEALRALQTAEAALQRLSAEEPAVEKLAAALTRAREAELAHPLVEAAAEAAAHLAEAQQGKEEQEARRNGAAAQQVLAAHDLEEEQSRAPAMATATAQLQRLSELQERVACWMEAEGRRRDAEGVEQRVAVALAQQHAAVAQCRAEREAAREAVAAALQASSGVVAAEGEVAQARALVRQCLARDEASAAVSANQRAAAQAEARFAEAQHELDKLEAELAACEAAWRSSRAAVLADSLREGEPCPVCGATVHPAPAHAAEMVDDAELDELRARLTQARTRRDASREALAATQVVVAEARAAYMTHLTVAPDGLSAEAAQRAAQECEAAWLALCMAAEAVPDPSATLAAHDEAVQAAETALKAAETAERSAATEVARRVGAASELAAAVPEELRDPAALERAVQQGRAAQSALEAALEVARAAAKAADEHMIAAQRDAEAAEKTLDRAAAAAAQATARRDDALRRHGFDGIAAYVAARLTPEAMVAAETRVRDFRETLAQARGSLTQARQRAGQHPVAGDLEGLRMASETAVNELKAAQAKAHEAASRLAELREVRRELDELDQRCARVADEYEVVGTLDQVASGQWGGGRITFQRWVLGAYLDDVLAAASRRLAVMSRNRFRLERQRSVTDLRRASGLDLAVFDAWSNRSRPAVTLSGGESFLAALSLALGLAETVQEQSGATPLETIFVDEGFGALDAGALDLAMDALMELKDSGRLVGVITHVPELRDVIDARLEVVGGPGGSRTRFIVP